MKIIITIIVMNTNNNNDKSYFFSKLEFGNLWRHKTLKIENFNFTFMFMSIV